MMLRSAATLILLLAPLALCHYHIHDWNVMSPALKLRGLLGEHESCDHPIPQIYSYHIHVIFWSTNEEKTRIAMELRDKFMERFNLTDKLCTIVPGDPAPGHQMCYFEEEMGPFGPFLQAQFSFFIPPELLQETSMWMLQHRGQLDVFIHPNSGCETNDHTKWNTYAGVKWPIDVSIFSCNYPGCKPPS